MLFRNLFVAIGEQGLQKVGVEGDAGLRRFQHLLELGVCRVRRNLLQNPSHLVIG